jgi:hypothetical protein
VLAIASGGAEDCSKDVGLTCTNCTHIEVRSLSVSVYICLATNFSLLQFCDPHFLKTEYVNCDQLTNGVKKYCNAGDCSGTPMPQCLGISPFLPVPETEREFRCTTSGAVPGLYILM